MMHVIQNKKLRRALKPVWLLAAVLLMASCASGPSIVVTTASPSAQTTPATTPAAKPTPVPTPEPTPEPTPTPDPIRVTISQMSDKELIGQMVMIGFTGTQDMDEDSVALMREYGVGNVLLFGWNTDTFSQTSALIAKVNAHNPSDIPLLVGIDLEGGTVYRFKDGQWSPALLSAQRLGEKNDPQLVYDQYLRIGEKLKSIGIDINFAPVLDIAHNPDETFLGKGKRMFGSDPDTVASLVCEAVDGLHGAGIASLGKHFPGHGETADDSHETLPVIDATLSEMESYALVPFQAAIGAGLDAMLVAHLSCPNLDSEYVTSVSPAVITGLLREQMGFEGVVFSDDLRMQGLRSRYSVGEGAVLHILAGGDVVLVGGKNNYSMQKKVLDALIEAVQSGRITRERLEESAHRILSLKMKYIGF
jgi:beta-N-acetylhexosaminidase